MDLIDILLSAAFWAAAIRIASPLIFATMGELICERAGVLNLGIEGIMVAGAFAGWIAVWAGLPLWGGGGGGDVGRYGRSARCTRPAHGALRPVTARGRHRHHACWPPR